MGKGPMISAVSQHDHHAELVQASFSQNEYLYSLSNFSNHSLKSVYACRNLKNTFQQGS